MTTAQRGLIVSAAAFVALTIVVVSNWVAGLDRRVTKWVFGWPDAWRGPMHAIWWFATRPVALVWIGLALLVWRKPQPAVAMVAAALASWGLALVSKVAVGRSRPTRALLGATPRHNLAGHGYPAAHAALAAALVIPVLFVAPRAWRPFLVAAIVVVGVSRVYSGAQFALDSLGGIALGATCGFGAVVLFSKVRPRIPA
ncbi:MAG TPA: phosphatase PAP2 family protein [Acidimicrobiales bacterium]|nr:phosphatase PAP2 family protein [Acidimicrobiales bacterium]